METRYHRLDDPDQCQVWMTPDGCIPQLLYWGEPLPPDCDMAALARAVQPILPHGGLDVPESVSWLPEPGRGFTDAPGLALRRRNRHLYTQFRMQTAERTAHGWDFHLHDGQAGLGLVLQLDLHAGSGVLSTCARLSNDGIDELAVDALATVSLPVPAHLCDKLSLTGRWAGEFQIAREAIGRAAWLQESRVGRSSHHAFPGLVLMEQGTNATQGEAWGLQVAWSGNHRLLVQALRLGGVQVQAGELLLPGELTLQPGEACVTPTVHLCRSSAGLSGLAQRWHRFVRQAVLPAHTRPRPVQFSTWEATYFDHDAQRLQALARKAAAVGVERFVLDDGWFVGRHNDRAGLGDWTPCPTRYPQGLAPFAACCHELGMQFGLWVEPEGVSRDSALFRSHPEWVLGIPGLEQPLGRHQYVLNLAIPAARTHLLQQLSALLRSAPIAFLKWDMNRDMTHPAGLEGRAAARMHVHGLYQLIDDLRQAFPTLDIETCASGGARADLGILRRTSRVWVSDCNDPIERQRMQQALLNFLPPEVMGVHIGDARSHTTGRLADMPLRTLNALFGHLGIEADLLKTTEAEEQHLREAIAFYKSQRHWLDGAEVTALDHPNPAIAATAAWSADGRQGLVTVIAVGTQTQAVPACLRLRGLEADRRYRVAWHPLWPADAGGAKTPAGLFADSSGITLPGQALQVAGLALPNLLPGTGVLITLEQEPSRI